MQNLKNSTNSQGILMVKPNRDWCDIPPEILHLVCKKLPDIYDFVVFHAVCKAWHACKCDPPLQLPWILEYRIFPDDPVLRFYSLSSGKILTITCIRSRKKCFIGPSCHYLVAYRHTKVGFLWSLLNPLTSDEIQLPQLEENKLYWVEWIGPDPTVSGKHIAVFSMCSMYGAPHPYSDTMILCRLEDQETSQFRLQGMNGNGRLCYNGGFFFVDRLTGVTKVTDSTTQKLVCELPPIDPDHHNWKFWMVESDGEILLLRKKCSLDQLHFDIFWLCLGSGEGSDSWVEVADIGEQVLFLDEYRGSSFCTIEYKGLGENCIYYLKDDFLYKYDIKDGITECLYCPFVGRDKTWFTPCFL